MKLDDLVPTESKYLTKEDVGEEGLDLAIKGFKRATVGEGDNADERAIMGFEGADIKPMVLNKTNMRRLKVILKAETTEDCKGKVVNVYNDPLIEYGGKIVGGIRIRQAQGKTEPGVDNDFDDDIPY